jgi:hypothetical protein
MRRGAWNTLITRELQADIEQIRQSEILNHNNPENSESEAAKPMYNQPLPNDDPPEIPRTISPLLKPKVYAAMSQIDSLSPHAKLCAGFSMAFVVLCFGVFLLYVAFTSDRHHLPENPSFIAISNGREQYFDLQEGTSVSSSVNTFFYRFSLNDVIQEWQIIPTDSTPLPYLNCSLEKVLSFSVCCRQATDGHELACTTGQTFDFFAFDARIREMAQFQLQCAVFLNSHHLANAQCVLEIKIQH